MGQLLGNLTNPNTALVSPQGQTTFTGSPAQVMSKANAGLPTAADLNAAAGPDVLHPQDTSSAFKNLPFIGKASFSQAANSGPYGMPNAASPELSKGGKLVTLLTSGLKGALAGRAAQEQMIAQTGGRRAGGIGTGFQAGFQLPFQQAQLGQQMQQQQAQTELTKQQGSMVQTPYGPLPAALAKAILPASIRGEASLEGKKIGAEASRDVADTRKQSAEDVAHINQGQGVPVPPDIAKAIGMPEMSTIPAGRGTWTNINKSLEAQGLRVQDMGKNGTDENSGMWLMNRTGNRIKQVSPNSLTFQRGASFAQNRPETVTDPNDPGYAYYTTAAEAMSKHLPSPQGAGTIAAKTEARSEVPKNIGDQKVAFNTAIQHAQLLENAARALNNGDVQAIAGLKNQFKNQFGSAGPVTAEAIADAYTREVTKMLSAGHLTDSEISTVGKTLNPNKQNMAQVLGVIGAYRALAQSKMNVLNQQAQSSRTRNAPAAKGQPAANDPLGIR